MKAFDFLLKLLKLLKCSFAISYSDFFVPVLTVAILYLSVLSVCTYHVLFLFDVHLHEVFRKAR